MKKKRELESIGQLLSIMDRLREDCPWDKKQTFESLSSLTVEETYELIDAISEDNNEEIKNELGDLLLHIIFYSKIASETNLFDISDVANSISNKLINRHPHIFKNKKEISENEVKRNWEKLKLSEGRKSVLSGVPNSLPPLLKAIRIQKKVSNIGFDWKKSKHVKKKVYEEIDEFFLEIESNNIDKAKEEFGDLLFSLINYSRHIGLDANSCLEISNKKFVKRFKALEKMIKEKNENFDTLTAKDMKKMWDLVKKIKS